MDVFWDSNLFMYLYEDHGELTTLTRELWTRMRDRSDILLTSTMSLGEILAGIPVDRVEIHTRLRSQLHAMAMVGAFDEAAALRYAAIRQDRSIRPPDAIQLACAANLGVELFVTNDERLSRKIVPGVPVLTSLRSVPI